MTVEDGWLHVTEAEVAAALDLRGAIAAVRSGFHAEGSGSASNMLKTLTDWGQERSTLHAVGAAFPADGVVGTKTWAHTSGGANPHLLLFDATTGTLVAAIEAFALGQLRTAAVSGVATDILATPDADELTIIGTGKQALAQVAAILAVRPIRRVRVHSRDPDRRAAFATQVQARLDVEATAVGSVAEAVDGAGVVTLATRATQPFLSADLVAVGAHVNAMGAITMDRQEFEPQLLARCDVITTDSVPSVQRLSREFTEYFGADGDWSRVRPLSALVASDVGRPPGADITLSKALGTGICDVAVGLACLEAVRAAGGGRRFPATRRVEPMLRTSA